MWEALKRKSCPSVVLLSINDLTFQNPPTIYIKQRLCYFQQLNRAQNLKPMQNLVSTLKRYHNEGVGGNKFLGCVVLDPIFLSSLPLLITFFSVCYSFSFSFLCSFFLPSFFPSTYLKYLRSTLHYLVVASLSKGIATSLPRTFVRFLLCRKLGSWLFIYVYLSICVPPDLRVSIYLFI